jgi:glutamate-5-semialdehyde dehydrogenase
MGFRIRKRGFAGWSAVKLFTTQGLWHKRTAMAAPQIIESLEAGMPILVGGNRIVRVTTQLAAEFRSGDTLGVVEGSDELLLIPRAERAIAEAAVGAAVRAFDAMREVSDAQITSFFRGFAERLADTDVWQAVASANTADIALAKERGRSTTRLEANERLRGAMIEGLRGWAEADSRRGRVVETVQHAGWRAELVSAPLGVVGFVFEGRPNVVADATGVLRGGNTVVFRIGRDALGTARAILAHALNPALRTAGLPEGAVSLIDSSSHAAGWALFGDARLALAVARGSGEAVAVLGALARAAGVPTSLHGTGGAWMIASEHADVGAFEDAVANSLDRKVCNTLNTCCIERSAAQVLIPAFLRGLERAAQKRRHPYKLHVAKGSESFVPAALFSSSVAIARASGVSREPQAVLVEDSELSKEWEWEDSPEVTLRVVDTVAEACALFNRYSPQFVASLISKNQREHAHFFESVNAPFVGDDITRWVDGQVALKKPELGLSNWERGRLFGRGGILAGDSVFTLRTRAVRD